MSLGNTNGSRHSAKYLFSSAQSFPLCLIKLWTFLFRSKYQTKYRRYWITKTLLSIKYKIFSLIKYKTLQNETFSTLCAIAAIQTRKKDVRAPSYPGDSCLYRYPHRYPHRHPYGRPYCRRPKIKNKKKKAKT